MCWWRRTRFPWTSNTEAYVQVEGARRRSATAMPTRIWWILCGSVWRRSRMRACQRRYEEVRQDAEADSQTPEHSFPMRRRSFRTRHRRSRTAGRSFGCGTAPPDREQELHAGEAELSGGEQELADARAQLAEERRSTGTEKPLCMRIRLCWMPPGRSWRKERRPWRRGKRSCPGARRSLRAPEQV